jgi:hypothetical protein
MRRVPADFSSSGEPYRAVCNVGAVCSVSFEP